MSKLYSLRSSSSAQLVDTESTAQDISNQAVLITQSEINAIVAKAVGDAIAASVRETTELFQRKLKEMEEKYERRVGELEGALHTAERHANQLEQYSRRSHLRIWGLETKQGEDCKTIVASFVRKLKGPSNAPLPCTEADIDAAHPLPLKNRRRSGAPSSSASCIIVRFFGRDLRDSVIKARRQLKGSKISIQEDLTAKNHLLLNELKKKDYVEGAWSWNGKIMAKLRDEQRPRRFDIYDI